MKSWPSSSASTSMHPSKVKRFRYRFRRIAATSPPVRTLSRKSPASPGTSDCPQRFRLERRRLFIVIPMYRMRIAARAALVGAGYNEAITYVTVDQTDIERFSDGAFSGDRGRFPHRVADPAQERAAVGPKPDASDPDSVHVAVARRKPQAQRIGSAGSRLARVYVPTESTMPNEVELVGLVAAGKRDSLGLDQGKQAIDFFEMKGASNWSWIASARNRQQLQPGVTQHFTRDGRLRSELVSRLSRDSVNCIRPLRQSYGIDDQRVLAGEINLTALMSAIARHGDVTPSSRVSCRSSRTSLLW